jgi:hypothetical protein
LPSAMYGYLGEHGGGLSPVQDFWVNLAGLPDADFGVTGDGKHRLDVLYLVVEVEFMGGNTPVVLPGVCPAL